VGGEGGGWDRDLRYKESFVDLAGRGVAADFCRAVYKKGKPESLRMACAIGGRDGMDTIEYSTRSVAEGFRFSRDDYWRVGANNRMDYCRILQDPDTQERYVSCAVAGLDNFKRAEERDTAPPPAIKVLLDAYDGALIWWRWFDDDLDYAEGAVFERHGNPEFPTLLNATVSRGLQFNRDPTKPTRDYLRWGEAKTLAIEDKIPPRQIHAVSFWIWWDAVEFGATVFEASNGKKDRVRLFAEGGGVKLEPASVTDGTFSESTFETSPATRLAIGEVIERRSPKPKKSDSATYVFEIWDDKHRIMRLDGGAGSIVTERWQHVTITTADESSWWPTWSMYVDGKLVGEKKDGRMPTAIELTQNFIGRGLRGCIQDFRMYRIPMPLDKIEASIAYGQPRLHPNP